MMTLVQLTLAGLLSAATTLPPPVGATTVMDLALGDVAVDGSTSNASAAAATQLTLAQHNATGSGTRTHTGAQHEPVPVPVPEPERPGLSAGTVALFSAMALLGAVGVQATGFGMAIIYLTTYEIISAAGGFDHEANAVTLKLAVFVQAIALASTLPFAIKAGAKLKDMRMSLLVPLVPATFVGTPCGQILQARINEDVVRVALGGTLLIACTLMLYKSRASVKKLAAGCLGCCSAHFPLRRSASAAGDAADAVDANTATATAMALGKRASYSLAVELGTGSTNAKDVDTADASEGAKDAAATDDADADAAAEGAIFSWRSLILVAVGFTSGFLGGLVGARGPPLILFFLFTSYPREIVRSNQIVVRTVNVSVRLLTYALVPPPADYTHGGGGDGVGWFNVEEHGALYLSVCVCAIVGTVVGEVAFRRVDNKDVYKAMLAGLVLVCAVGMLAKGAVNLQQ